MNKWQRYAVIVLALAGAVALVLWQQPMTAGEWVRAVLMFSAGGLWSHYKSELRAERKRDEAEP